MRRRSFLQSGTAALVFAPMGCAKVVTGTRVELSDQAVDIHTHYFNATDLPVNGFLQQVQFGFDPDNAGGLVDGVIKLAVTLLTLGTDDARTEYNKIVNRNGLRVRSDRSMRQSDERRVAQAFEIIIREEQDDIGAESGEDGARLQPFVEELRLELDPDFGIETETAPRTPSGEARRLARRLYEVSEFEDLGLESGEDDPEGDGFEYVVRTEFAQTLRWVGLLTRSRVDILGEYKKLYVRGEPRGIQIAAPSLVDLNAWLSFEEDDEFSPLDDQVDVSMALAAAERDILILNFVAFCPLRSALEREDMGGGSGDTKSLARVKSAVLEKGFVGVKLYPPMGFRPLGNAGLPLPDLRRTPSGGGSALDDEMRALFEWCQDNSVPVKAHASNSNAASKCAGLHANPRHWDHVLRQYPDLRLNLAHFGGFGEHRGDSPCLPAGSRDWEEEMMRLAARHPNAYFDFGFWMEVAVAGSDDDELSRRRARRLLERDRATLTSNLIMGTDFSMIGRIPRHEDYFGFTRRALDNLELQPEELQAIESGNALRYLGLDAPGPVYDRLNAFFQMHNNPVIQVLGPNS